MIIHVLVFGTYPWFIISQTIFAMCVYELIQPVSMLLKPCSKVVCFADINNFAIPLRIRELEIIGGFYYIYTCVPSKF